MSSSSTCPRCGASNAPGVRFCASCGQSLAAPAAPVPPSNVAAPGYPPMYPPPPKQAAAGTILQDAFDVFMKDPFLYLGIYLVYSIITSIITLVVSVLALKVARATLSPFAVPTTSDVGLLVTFIGVAIGVAVLDAIIGAIVSGMTTYYAVQRYRGTPTTSNMALGEGMRRFLSIIGAQILVVLAGVGLLFIPIFVVIAGAFVGSLALIGVGLLLFIVVGVFAIYLLIGWSVSTAAIMMEGKTAFASLSRSWELTRGHRLSIFAAGLVVILAGIVVSAILEAIFGIGGPYGAAVGSILATAVTGSWIVITTGVAYHLLVSGPRAPMYAPPPPVAPMPPR